MDKLQWIFTSVYLSPYTPGLSLLNAIRLAGAKSSRLADRSSITLREVGFYIRIAISSRFIYYDIIYLYFASLFNPLQSSSYGIQDRRKYVRYHE